jgi:hypothetical protein
MSGTRIPRDFPLDLAGREHSKGERKFHREFGLDDGCHGMTLIHSVFITSHIRNISGELDFVLLVPGRGIFLLEVKHGRLSKEKGIWYTEGRHGKGALRVSPFRQLHDTARSLEGWLRKRLAEPGVRAKYGDHVVRQLSHMRIGTGFVFSFEPDWTHRDTEHEPWMVCTSPMLDMDRGVSNFIEILAYGYQKIEAWRRAVPPDRIACNCLRDLLAGDLEVHYNVLRQFSDEERALRQLTSQQLEVLANTRYNPRCLFTGGAGTGKTVLAMELYLEKVQAGDRVALFCFNRGLASHLQDKLGHAEGMDLHRNPVCNLHAFLLERTGLTPPDEDLDRFFQKDLVDAFLDMVEEAPFDHIIVDEAQDLLTIEYLWVLNALVKGGLAKGSWTLFGDISHQLLFRNEQQVHEALEFLGQNAAFYRAPPLKLNCRNTRRIGMSLPIHTGCAGLLSPDDAPEGAPLAQRFPATTARRNEELCRILGDLNDLPPGAITILAPRKDVLKELGDLPEVRAAGCRLETIQAFKGLESPVVILTGFRSLLSDEDVQLLYVGMSRARNRLYLLLEKHLEKEYHDLLRRFIQLDP